MQIKETTRTNTKRLPPEKYDELVKKMRKEHEKPIKGMFEFLDAQGGWLDFVHRFFNDDPIYTIRLTHGEICELPMGIVKHLNNTKKKIRSLDASYSANNRGVPKTYETQSRIRFTPVDVL